MTAAAVERTEAAVAQTRPARIMRALSSSAAPLSTPDLVRLLDEGISPNQQALTWYGQILRSYAETGRVTRYGRTPGAWQRAPAETWRITEAGRRWLAGYDAEPAKAAAAKAEAEQAATEAQRAATARTALLEQARALYGRATPRASRAQAAHKLRNAGCTLEEVGAVFGVTREMIRLDLLLDPGAAPRRPGRPPWRSVRTGPTACALSLGAAGEIFRLRAERGWSLSRLAREAGLPPASMGNYEGGAANYPLPVLEKIAAALGVSPLILLGAPPGEAAS
jgi:Helix-turn-helix domain